MKKYKKDGDAINKEKGMAVMAITLCRILQEKTFTNNNKKLQQFEQNHNFFSNMLCQSNI